MLNQTLPERPRSFQASPKWIHVAEAEFQRQKLDMDKYLFGR